MEITHQNKFRKFLKKKDGNSNLTPKQNLKNLKREIYEFKHEWNSMEYIKSNIFIFKRVFKNWQHYYMYVF